VFAANKDFPFLGSLPLNPQVRTGSDDDDPAVLGSGATADVSEAMTANVADMVEITRRRNVMN